jgi:hypothetical protein
MAEKFLDNVVFRSTPVLTDAIARGCAKAGVFQAEYIRQAVIERLKADGIIEPQQADGIKPSAAAHVSGRKREA